MTARETFWLSSLGGSGENGRNCHLIGCDGGLLLLDCGVGRGTRPDSVGSYPALTEALAARVTAVFLSHCHEDHAAALPLLVRLGYAGPVYATAETVRETGGMLRKWREFVTARGGELPYGPEDCDRIRWAPVAPGGPLPAPCVGLGSSGHLPGGVWFLFSLGGKRVLYTGDLCLQPLGEPLAFPPACDAAVTDCSYAGKAFDQQEQLERLVSLAEATLRAGGSALLPVPAQGRGPDLALLLQERLTGRLVLDGTVAAELGTRLAAGTEVAATRTERERAVRGPGVFLTTDGMLTTEESAVYLRAVAPDANSRVILTGHAAEGTPAAGLLDAAWRRAHGVRAAAERIFIKVHMDERDLLEFARRTGARKLLLFHSDDDLSPGARAALGDREVKTLRYPEKMEL